VIKKQLSQRTIVATGRILRSFGSDRHELESEPDIGEFLYEHDFPNWFVTHARSHYTMDWGEILPAVRDGSFFFPHSYFAMPGTNITGQDLNPADAEILGEILLQRLAALASTMPGGESAARSLELDGFQVNKKNLELTPAEMVVNEQEEEDRVSELVKKSGLSGATVILKHIRDARDLFVDGKDHSSIGEARSFIQALIDNISQETDQHGGHSIGYPGGTANRLDYLRSVGFFTPDERTAVGASWGFLSAGSHPGLSSRDEARIGLILSLEFGVLLLAKFSSWKSHLYRGFS
jgi:hypothetical protein